MKSITVFVITYNQEDVIRRAIDSILGQKEWGLHQILIGDDCSKDRTFDVLMDYQQKYPNIVRPIRNEKNLGIYRNLQNLIQFREETDLYSFCAGDDVYCEGYFKALQEYIMTNKVSTLGEVGFYSDWKQVNPDGKSIIRRQDIVTQGFRLWGLHMRGHICGRSLVYSRSVIDQFQPVPFDKGLHLAEGFWGSQAPRIIKNVYYFPRITTIYYSGIGISTVLSKTKYSTTENIDKWEYYLEHLLTEDSDKKYAYYQINLSNYLIKPSFKYFCCTLWYYILGGYPPSIKIIKKTLGLARNLLLIAKQTK